jgi:hypothetical protein
MESVAEISVICSASIFRTNCHAHTVQTTKTELTPTGNYGLRIKSRNVNPFVAKPPDLFKKKF